MFGELPAPVPLLAPLLAPPVGAPTSDPGDGDGEGAAERAPAETRKLETASNTRLPDGMPAPTATASSSTRAEVPLSSAVSSVVCRTGSTIASANTATSACVAFSADGGVLEKGVEEVACKRRTMASALAPGVVNDARATALG